MVAAIDAADPKEIPMTKAKLRRKAASRSNNSEIKVRNSAVRRTALKSLKLKRVTKSARLKPVTKSAAVQKPRPVSQQPGRRESKQARVIAMLQAPGGATIDAMKRATGWQQHSVRGFLAGVVRKKLCLNLVSADGDKGRVYRITDRTTSAAA